MDIEGDLEIFFFGDFEKDVVYLATHPVEGIVVFPPVTNLVRLDPLGYPKAEYVFVNDAGTPYATDVFLRKLERWCDRAEIEQKPPYALRHTFASMQADGDTNMVALGQLMGHSSTRTTARYIRASCEHHVKAVERGAEHILSLMSKPAGVEGDGIEEGKKVATKVATNPIPEKETGGYIAVTACDLTI